MRWVLRLNLAPTEAAYLKQRQIDAISEKKNGSLNVATMWKNTRQTTEMKSVLGTLHAMAGPTQRCMYCCDSFGDCIEHFFPKSPHWNRMFRWRNMLLCCTQCGRIKFNKFPIDQSGRPLLIDPSKEEPWDFLDFDPRTGNITARIDPISGNPCKKGEATVIALDLDKREGVSAAYVRTYKRLLNLIGAFVNTPTETNHFINVLLDKDDHGLLGWLFKGSGQSEPLTRQLASDHPAVWHACQKAFLYC